MTDRPYIRESDVTIEHLTHTARRWLPLITCCALLATFFSCLETGFTVTGWKGMTPAARFERVEGKIDSTARMAHRENISLRVYVDSNVERIEHEESLGVADRHQMRASIDDGHRMMEDLLVLACTNSSVKNTRMTNAICDRYLDRRGGA